MTTKHAPAVLLRNLLLLVDRHTEYAIDKIPGYKGKASLSSVITAKLPETRRITLNEFRGLLYACNVLRIGIIIRK